MTNPPRRGYGLECCAVEITCGWCGRSVGTADTAHDQSAKIQALRCPACKKGSVWNEGEAVFPIHVPGPGVQHLPGDVEQAWKEARATFGAGAFTASEIMCRKILMHLAVDRCAVAEGEPFVAYVDALEGAGYITTGLKSVVDSIRVRGNRANHDLAASTEDEAMTTLSIVEHMLRSLYELPGLVPPAP